MKSQSTKSINYLFLLVIVTGLIFRLWGLTWGLYSYPPLHPDEGSDCPIIIHMIHGDFSKVGLETFYYVYYYFLAVVYLLIREITYLSGYIFAIYRVKSDAVIDMVLIGRIASVIISTLNIWLLYFIGKRIFQSRYIGIMAAALMAVTPLSVAQAHYLEMDTPLAFMATLSLLGAYLILTRKNSSYFALGGLIYGLTFTTKPNGILLIIPFFVSFGYLFFDESFKKARKSLLKRIVLFATITLLGFIIGAPGLFFNFPQTIDRVLGVTMEMAKTSPPWTGSWIEGPQGSRFAWAIQTLRDGFGIILIAISFLGIIYYLIRKNKEVILVSSFPVCYFFIVGFFGRRFGERDVVVMIPFLVLLVVVFFYNFFNNWYPWRYKKIVLTILFLGLLVWPTWKSIEVDYYYWLDDNRDLAEKWLNNNLPSESIVALDGYTPYRIKFPTIDFEHLRSIEYYRNNSDFVVTSTLEGDRYFNLWTHRPTNPRGENLLFLQRNLKLIKEFDLKHRGTGIDKNGYLRFPDFLDPVLRVFSTKAGPIKHKILIPALHEDAKKSFKVVFLNHPEYEKSNGIFVVKPYSESVRVLRTTNKLKTIQLIVYSENQAEVTIQCGSSKEEKNMESGQVEIFQLEPSLAFPYIENIYSLKVFSQSNGNVFVKWVVDPVEIGLNWLKVNQPKQAITFFEKTSRLDPENLENLALLGTAYHQAGKISEALKQFDEIKRKDPGYLSAYYSLVKNNLTGEDWLKSFCNFTNFYQPLLKKKVTYSYLLPDQSTFPLKPLNVSKDNYSANYNKGEDGLPFFKLWSRDVFPQGIYNVHFRLAGSTTGRVGPALRVDVLKHTHNGFYKIAEKVIRYSEISKTQNGIQDIDLTVRNDARIGQQFEFRVFSLQEEVQFIIKGIEVSVDIKKAMEEHFKPILFALAKSYLARGDSGSAISTFQKLFDLDPEYNEICWHLGNLLLQSGYRSESLSYYKKYEELNPNNPSRLRALQKQYEIIKEPKAAERVKEMISRQPSPSMKSQAFFSDQIELMGYSLEKNMIKRGEVIKGSLYWKSLVKMNLDYDFFLHGVKDDQIRFQGDPPLKEGDTIFPSLGPGEIVKRDFLIKIPADIPTGVYKIFLGLWDARYSGKRLKITYPIPYAYQDKYLLTQIELY